MVSQITDLPARIRQENINVYRASPQRLREDVGQEAQIAQDYRGRLVYEFLQNADDALSQDSSPQATIALFLEDDALWVANSGRPLDEADVRGLCGISASSKAGGIQKRRASIGHKGMGFKSVLEITDAPEVYSTSLSFGFGPQRALEAVRDLLQEKRLPEGTRAPVTRFPWLLTEEPVRWRELREGGMRTAFRFPLRSKMTAEQRASLARSLLGVPVTSLLFLKRLGRVEVTVPGPDKLYKFAWTVVRRRVTESGLQDVEAFTESGTYHVTLKSDDGRAEAFLVVHDPDIGIGSHRGGLDEITWEGIDVAEVSVAARLCDEHPVALEPEWKKLHVFLPTGEPCPYDVLISGAFSSNLSRQEIRVESDASNYNRFLLRQSARMLRDLLVPQLLHGGASVVDVLRLLNRAVPPGAPCTTRAAQTLFDEMRTVLQDFAFLPTESGEPLTIASCVVPLLVDDATVGRDLRRLLPREAALGQQRFPDAPLCGSDVARVLVDHGAYELGPEDAASALAGSAPERARLVVGSRLSVDPVLSVLERLWVALDADGREQLARAARTQKLFPVGTTDGGIVLRIATSGIACFYPPRSLRGTLPLDGICFLMQEICWGDLPRNERNVQLRQQLVAWQALFDVQEFKFPAVMRASVLPALDLERGTSASGARESLRDLDRIAAICQLAGRSPKATEPLPYERLGSNRALFNLSRLDVPCRSAYGERIVWAPAYCVYLGSDWVGENSVERILDAGRKQEIAGLPDFMFLAGPETFAGLLARHDHLREAPGADDVEAGTDEVSLDEDEEAALESDEKSRWLNFFQWLGVSQALRPVHFHDVEDRASGWLKTIGLKRPEGWIFRELDAAVWRKYLAGVERSLAMLGRANDAVPYFYELHDLDHLVTLLRAASHDASAELGKALYEHLARNWSFLERFSTALVARVPSDYVPSMRAKPQRARDEELVEAGPDFWLARLRDAPFCPTGHGPRHARQTWLPTLELERRFGRRNRTGSHLIPALTADPPVLKGKARGLAQALGMREELSQTTFTLDDAKLVLKRLHELYSKDFEAGKDLRLDLREVIRPAYRNLFELLSGRDQASRDATSSEAPPLAGLPLLAHDGRKGYRFVEDGRLYYMDRRETRDQLQSDQNVWTFVMEALPAARTAIVQLFGVPVLEESLQWTPRPGESSFIRTEDLETLRAQIGVVAPYLLARIGVDRADERLARQDAHRLRRFITCVEAVTRLELGWQLEGTALRLGGLSRDAFVALDGDNVTLAFLVWGESPWPPSPRDAEALANALCDVFGAGYFEPFLALVQAKTPQDRERLLRRAGAHLDVEEKRALLSGSEKEVEPSEVLDVGVADPRSISGIEYEERQAVPASEGGRNGSTVTTARTPLFSAEQLLIDGEPMVLTGSTAVPSTWDASTHRTDRVGERPSGTRSGGYGGHTDLDALDAVGMWVALNFEKNRLRKSGLNAAEIFDPSDSCDQPQALVFDVSTPTKIEYAMARSIDFRKIFTRLRDEFGISVEWPGFDVLSLDPSSPSWFARLIELKSSGVNSRVQAMSWNEWKAASTSELRNNFYLYLVGNLRSDLQDSRPFIRTIRNPFEQLASEVQTDRSTSRKVQLSLDTFKEAEHLVLSIATDLTNGS